MKCTNTRPCDGEMKPLVASHNGQNVSECVKCGFRIDATEDKPAPKKAKEVSNSNKEN